MKRWRPTSTGQSILVPLPAPLHAKAQKQLDTLLAAAQAHGEESDPDHEVGDLQDMLAATWELLSQNARDDVYDDFMELIDEWL